MQLSRRPLRPAHARFHCRVGAVLVALCAAPFTVVPRTEAASADQLSDAEAKAEYAYFTEDRPALEHLVAELRPFAQSSDALELYVLAHAQFRRLQLAATAHAPREAEDAGNGCLAALDRRGAALAHDAEALALAAGCSGYLAGLGGLKRLTAGHRRDSSLEAARALAPANPRVLLTGGILGWFGSTTPAAKAEARAAFTHAATLFDRVSETKPGEPTWGGAEAWLFVGRGLEDDGNLVGARNAYERALMIAPDFAVARRRLARLAGHH